LDIPGSLLSIAGLLALVYGIIQAGIDGWTAHNVLYAFGAAVVLLALFALRESRTKEPMLRLGFFKNPSFTGANIAITLVFFGLMGSFFFMGQYLQSVHGYTPLEAGVRLLPMASSAQLARLIGTKYTVALGILTAGIGFFYFARIAGVNTPYPAIALGMCITALGMGLTMSPATNSIMGSVPVGEAGVGSAMNDTTRQIGGALGVAVLGTLMNSSYIKQINIIQWPAQVPSQVISAARSSIQGAHIAAQNVPNQQLSQFIISKADQAFVYAMTHGLMISAIIMATASLVTLIILPNKVRAYKEEIHSVPKKKPDRLG
jgi:hypothetical protein